ncbi:hypothetical protein AAXB25_14835 [Paenibacillus lautus]|uniref:hypothetical protein n=1 Tax=Paenibacillus lautus TaxID=1401 RepID=UPI003D2C7B0A
MEIQNGKFSLIEANLTEEDFKREWSHIERAGVFALLDELLTEHYGEPMNANSFFGLVWTSSGRFGELGVQDPDITIDGNELNAFLIRNNNQLVAHCFDNDNNDLFYEVQ